MQPMTENVNIFLSTTNKVNSTYDRLSPFPFQYVLVPHFTIESKSYSFMYVRIFFWYEKFGDWRDDNETNDNDALLKWAKWTRKRSLILFS